MHFGRSKPSYLVAAWIGWGVCVGGAENGSWVCRHLGRWRVWEESRSSHTHGSLRRARKPVALGAETRCPGHCLALEKYGLAPYPLLMDPPGLGRQEVRTMASALIRKWGVQISPQILFIFFRCLHV